MKGLFDLLNSDDPAIRQGLLQAGVALLGSRGNFGQSLGQGLGAGLLGTQQFRDRQSQMERQKLQDQLLQGQVGQMRQQESLAQLPGRYIVPPSAPTVDATGGMETAGENPNNSNAGRMDLAGLANAYMAAPGGLQSGMALQQSLQKAGPQLREFDPTKTYGTFENGVFNPVIKGTPKTDLPNAAQEYEYAQKQGYKGTFEQWKAAQKPEPNNVTYSAPVPFLMPDGTVGYAQPGNRAGAPPQVLKDPVTGKPLAQPKQGSDKDPTEFQSKAGLYFKSMATASQTLDSIEKTNGWRPSIVETAAPGETAKTLAQTEARQKYTQAQKQWIDSINRVRSGANLPELEYERAVRTFFPVYGEGENLRAQKAAARRQEEAAMQQAAGRAIKQPQPGGVVDFSELK
jgi:hypothetical protein